MASFAINQSRNFKKITSGKGFQSGFYSVLRGLSITIFILSIFVYFYALVNKIATLPNVCFVLAGLSGYYLLFYYFARVLRAHLVLSDHKFYFLVKSYCDIIPL